VSFVGFDASTSLVTALRGGQLHGLVVQNPLLMGYLGVKTMVAHIKGEPVEKRIDTGVVIITPENVDSPETKELINPPLSEYLDEG
jgi:ribose transport system substrate-binding protein